MNLTVLLILIILLITCIIIKIIKSRFKQSEEAFNGIVNRGIINSAQLNSGTNEPEANEPENPENPNDDKADQTIIDLNKLNDSVNNQVETFLFLDTPFKSSFNYIIITIENLILKLFKTKSGYIVTNKDVNKVYVPYKHKLQPAPFNPYMPVSRIPKYCYMNVIPVAPNGIYLRKGDYYYYYNKNGYDAGLYSWYHHNNYVHKKETRNLIQGLYDKIKHLEEKAFKNPQIIKEKVPVYISNDKPQSPPQINVEVNNNNNPNKTLQSMIDKLPVIESSDNDQQLGSTNVINASVNSKIADAPSDELDKVNAQYAEPKVRMDSIEPSVPKVEDELQTPPPKVEPPMSELLKEEKDVKETTPSEPTLNEPPAEAQPPSKPEEILSILDDKPQSNNSSDIPELPKETFWSRLGF